MVIENGCWVTLRYRLFDLQGEPVEDRPRELRYLHGGYGFVFAGVEAALAGRSAGSSLSIVLEPEDHFGDYDADLIELVPVERLPEEVEIGMSLDALPGGADVGDHVGDRDPDDDSLETVDDERVWTITDIAEGVAVLDANHPLAGLALRFEIEVIEVELASEDEIEVERQLSSFS
jgi:FKBP-type peptidyl-prolyl cis-trans isomerase SlyD